VDQFGCETKADGLGERFGIAYRAKVVLPLDRAGSELGRLDLQWTLIHLQSTGGDHSGPTLIVLFRYLPANPVGPNMILPSLISDDIALAS
jgi:hypothetical protein